jgi:hypothetical protein
MRMADARALTDFWLDCPPENEMLAMLAMVYSTWKPRAVKTLTEEEQRAAHQASLEARWKAGAMNPAQMLAAMGGAKAVAVGMDGVLRPASSTDVANLPGAH